MILTSPHDWCDSILLHDTVKFPDPFPFCVAKWPVIVNVSLVVIGTSMDCWIDMLLTSREGAPLKWMHVIKNDHMCILLKFFYLGVGHRFLHPGASEERKIDKIWSHWVRDCILPLAQNHGGAGWECDFWYFSESRFSPIEATYIEFLTLKREDCTVSFEITNLLLKSKKNTWLWVTDSKK